MGSASAKKDPSIRQGLRRLPVRPIYLVSMQHEGSANIITIGMFAVFSGNPTLVGIGVKPSRFSYDLIKESGEFVVNIVDEGLMKAVRLCGENSGRDLDKFAKAELTATKGVMVKAPSIKESPVSLECKVLKEIETGDHVWFIGEVLSANVREGYRWSEGLLFKWVDAEGVFHKIGQPVGKY